MRQGGGGGMIEVGACTVDGRGALDLCSGQVPFIIYRTSMIFKLQVSLLE